MSSIIKQDDSEKSPLNFGISVWTPLSAVPGSPSLFYFQPLLYGKVFVSAAILIGAQLFLFLAQHLFGLEEVSILCSQSEVEKHFVRIPVSKLREFLISLSQNPVPDDSFLMHNLESQVPSSALPNQTYEGFLTTQTAQISLIVGLSVAGHFSSKPYSPLNFLTLPVFVLRGIRGSLPILILGMLGTIFVRAIVPPELTGAKP
ncbi:MAG: hypothetical protein PHZ11_07755 [Desulfitobacteriaceae bacterium]|nr:hypothetical protein [Desulfitobacteriaceae bacterium]MDD4346763.1 hypothetical protein [Desulfitobacteriaceae bacterium]MDD4401800.1 hypothetical protein [Desulfitobacteriaceae bacterium]